MTLPILDQLARELGQKLGIKATGTPTYNPPFTGTGLFANCGFEDALYTAFCGPGEGLIDFIPWRGTEYDDVRWEVLTDIVETGAEPTSDCAHCPTASLRTCWLNTCFGQYCRSTEEFSLHKVIRRAPGTNVRRLIGGVLGMPDNLAWGNGQPLDIAELLLVGLGHSLRWLIQRQAWQGNAQNTAPPGYEEMNGMARLVNTGLLDAFNGAACGAIDSDVKDFADACIGAVGAPSIAAFLTSIYRHIKNRLSRAQLNPKGGTHQIWMRSDLWDCVASAWPALYVQLATPAVTIGRVDQTFIFNLWQEIRQRQALPVDGDWIPVMFDSGIPGAYNNAGTQFTSDIYFLTHRFNGEDIIYGEYLDYAAGIRRLSQAQVFARFFQSGNLYSTDNGRFLHWVDNVAACVDATTWFIPRILVKAPWLQGRVTDVCCNVLQPYCGPDYAGFAPGGHAAVTATTLQGPC